MEVRWPSRAYPAKEAEKTWPELVGTKRSRCSGARRGQQMRLVVWR